MPSLAEKVAKELFDMTEKIRLRFEKNKSDRERIAEKIKNKEKPTGYRVDWLARTAGEVLEVVRTAAKDFNSNHPNDIATSDDLLDVLEIVARKIKQPKD